MDTVKATLQAGEIVYRQRDMHHSPTFLDAYNDQQKKNQTES